MRRLPGQLSETLNLLDLRLSKVFRFKGLRLEGMADIYNVLNQNSTTGESQAVGPAFGTPSEPIEGRLLRVGLQLRF